MKKLVVILCLLFSVNAFAGTVTTSGITAQQIISDAEVYLDAASDPFFPDSVFLQWIDEAVKETIYRTDCTETTPVSVALVTNTYQYSLGQTFLKVVAVEHNNGDTTDSHQIKTLDRVHINDTGHNDASGRPDVYDVWNDKIQVWPIPRAEENGTSLAVYTVPVPTGVSSTSSAIETPSYLDTALVYYVVAMGHYRNRMPNRGDRFMALWEKRLAEYRALISQRKPIE